MPKSVKEIGINQGKNVKKIREDIVGKSQREIAEKANTYQQNISRMENKRKLTEAEKQTLASALGVNVEDIEYFDKEKVLLKVFKENSPTAKDNADLNFGGEQYKIVNPLDKVSELYERLIKYEKYIVYLEARLDASNIDYQEKKKEILDTDKKTE